MSKVTIEKKELNELVRDSMILAEVRAWGLDNWQGMDNVRYPSHEEVVKEVERAYTNGR